MFIVLATYPLEAILPLIGADRPPIKMDTSFGTFRVRACGARLECLRRNQTCVECGITGTFFKLEVNRFPNEWYSTNCFIEDCSLCHHYSERYHTQYQYRDPHFNLYAEHPSNKSHVLMTRDHIVPRCLGGSNKIENSQTMCRKCNSRKGGRSPQQYLQLKEQWKQYGFLPSIPSLGHKL